jgi:AcrR family transcriptional regulator
MTNPDAARQKRLLDAGLVGFMRFGFRKTSMEEVAKLAQLSRQGLYLHFATKEELFRAVVRHALTTSLDAVDEKLADPDLSVEHKLEAAFDAWTGRYVGMVGADVTDLEQVTSELVGTLIQDHEALFVEKITKTIRGSGLPAAYKPAGLNARQLAENLYATARGLKHSVRSRDEFGERMGQAIRALCLPLRDVA